MVRFVIALSFALLACSDDNVGNDGTYVGGPCTSSNQCDSVCQTGGDFPQGLCTRACMTESDCPDGTHCIDKEGGICELACQTSADCRSGFTCEPKKNKGDPNESLVCAN